LFGSGLLHQLPSAATAFILALLPTDDLRLSENAPLALIQEMEKIVSQQQSKTVVNGPDSPHFTTAEDPQEQVPAWTEVDEGRFMPRRVRGSGRGRALG